MDMTEGPILPKILAFSGPLILTGILQLLYNAADVIVVGNYAEGHAPLAAVSSTGSLINLLVNIFMGLSVGASVVIARNYGARDIIALRKAEHTAITLALIMGIGVGAFGFLMARPLLQMMGSPDDVIDGATLYVKIYFLGMPANMLYNFGAATLRAVGDTKRPMYYLMIAGAVNVVLNLILVIAFHMDVAGVAIATVASQVISMTLVLFCLLRTRGVTQLVISECRIDRKSMRDMIRIGLPAGLQGSLFSISNVLIQSSINSFGSVVMAGNGVASNIEGFVYTAMNAQHQADMTFASQNYGAGKMDRVRKTLWCCLGTVTVIGLVMGLLIRLFGAQLIGLYNSDPLVIAAGLARMDVILPTYFLCGLMDVMVGQMRGIGYSVMPMIVSLTGACLLRIVWILTIFAAQPTQTILYISYPISWGITFAAHFACYRIVSGKALKPRPAE
uniref:Na+ driven multidrug efflux pump n=1 Tax=uncultured bacterium Contig11 TaxID=1393376 RepID=W0FKH7_9BACT|nr:Na+ driven multidrug efflux pump [uncultured bacterium Contig11]